MTAQTAPAEIVTTGAGNPNAAGRVRARGTRLSQSGYLASRNQLLPRLFGHQLRSPAMAIAPIYAFDKSSDLRARLPATYPDRPVWVVQGPSLSGGGYRVVAGPLSAAEAAALPPLPAP